MTTNWLLVGLDFEDGEIGSSVGESGCSIDDRIVEIFRRGSKEHSSRNTEI